MDDNDQRQQQDAHQQIIASIAVPALMRAAQATDNEVRDQAVLTLGDLAAHCAECRRHVPAAGVLQMLVNLLESPNYQQQQPRATVIRCLRNVLQDGDPDLDQPTVCRLLAALESTINAFGTGDIVCDAVSSVAWLISRPADGSFGFGRCVEEKRYIVNVYLLLAHPDLVGSILALLRSDSIPLLTCALKLVTNLSGGSITMQGWKEQITAVFHSAVFRDILVLANSDNDDISRDSLKILSNVVCSNEQIMTRMFSVRGMVETLFRLTNDPSRDKREVACETFINAILNASQAVYERLLNGGLARAWVQLWDDYIQRSELDKSFLCGIDWLLDRLREELQRRPESRELSVILFRQAGMVQRLQQVAPDEEEAASILREFFGLEWTSAADELRSATSRSNDVAESHSSDG